ncbi:unnamed protein product [Symbiodinium sp. CCMP2592]|nr:unnamed protein product [Symbiodinium sp. CCMP2592]
MSDPARATAEDNLAGELAGPGTVLSFASPVAGFISDVFPTSATTRSHVSSESDCDAHRLVDRFPAAGSALDYVDDSADGRAVADAALWARLQRLEQERRSFPWSSASEQQGWIRVVRNGVEESVVSWSGRDTMTALTNAAAQTCGSPFDAWQVEEIEMRLRSCGTRASFESTIEDAMADNMSRALRLLRSGRFGRRVAASRRRR